MALPQRSRFNFGDAGDLTATLPAKPWVPADETVGGSRTSAAGVPASYIVRRDALLTLTLRVEEADWPAYLALIAFGQSARSFTWYPDAAEATSFAVYLQEPAPGARYQPTRDGTYPRVLDATLTLRSVDGLALWLPYF